MHFSATNFQDNTFLLKCWQGITEPEEPTCLVNLCYGPRGGSFLDWKDRKEGRRNWKIFGKFFSGAFHSWRT